MLHKLVKYLNLALLLIPSVIIIDGFSNPAPMADSPLESIPVTNSSKTTIPVKDIPYLPRDKGNYLNIYYSSHRFAEPVGWYNWPTPVVMVGPLARENVFKFSSVPCFVSGSTVPIEIENFPLALTRVTNVEFYEPKDPETINFDSKLSLSDFNAVEKKDSLGFTTVTTQPFNFSIHFKFEGQFPYSPTSQGCICKKCGSNFMCDMGCPSECVKQRLQNSLFINVTAEVGPVGTATTFQSGLIPLNIREGSNFSTVTIIIYVVVGGAVLIAAILIYTAIRRRVKKYKIDVI